MKLPSVERGPQKFSILNKVLKGITKVKDSVLQASKQTAEELLTKAQPATPPKPKLDLYKMP